MIGGFEPFMREESITIPGLGSNGKKLERRREKEKKRKRERRERNRETSLV